MDPVLFPDDTSFWFETLRVLGHTAYGTADIGEVLTTAQSIKAGDYDSWQTGSPPMLGAPCRQVTTSAPVTV
jgi:hypothetical protein